MNRTATTHLPLPSAVAPQHTLLSGLLTRSLPQACDPTAPHVIAAALAHDLYRNSGPFGAATRLALESLARMPGRLDSLDGVSAAESLAHLTSSLRDWNDPVAAPWRQHLLTVATGSFGRPYERRLLLTTRRSPTAAAQVRCRCGQWAPTAVLARLTGHPDLARLDARIARRWWPNLPTAVRDATRPFAACTRHRTHQLTGISTQLVSALEWGRPTLSYADVASRCGTTLVPLQHGRGPDVAVLAAANGHPLSHLDG